MSTDRKIQQFFNDDFPIDTSSISSALADLRRMFSLKYEGGSSYGPISTPQGTMGIRLANHNASGDNFAKDEGDFFVSIFIEKQVFPHQKTHIPYREFWFPKETFEQDRTGVVNAVVNIVASAIETGEAVDTSGLSKMTDYPNEFETQGSRGQGQDLTSTANQPAGSDDVKESLAKAYKYSKGNTMKRRINENAKITLTIGQLKKLVKESVLKESTDEWERLTWGDLKKMMAEIKANDDTIISCGWRGDVPYGGKTFRIIDYSMFDYDEDEDWNKTNPKEVALLWIDK